MTFTFPRSRRALTGLACGAAALCTLPTDAATFRIEIDYMVGTHTHQPSQLVIDAVVQMFACQGHTLIIEVDDAIPHYNTLIRDPNNCDSFFGYSGDDNSFGAIKAKFFDHTHEGGWHYCIFGHNYQDDNCSFTSSSGLGQRPGWNFVVTLGSFSGGTGTEFDQAATLAHEFGHNLGLTHCGGMNCGGSEGDPDYVGPYTPNLASIMSYRYQLAGLRANMLANNVAPTEALLKNIDYSHGRLCTINENALNEFFGVGMRSTDWNCSGAIQNSVAQDVNGGNSGWCGSNGSLTSLSDFNEWAVIADPPVALAGGQSEDVSCITFEEWQQVLKGIAGGQPTLEVEGCQGGRNVFIGASIANVGTCTFPYTTLTTAEAASPANSRYFFKPGVYNEAGVVTLNNPGIYMCYTGTAEVR